MFQINVHNDAIKCNNVACTWNKNQELMSVVCYTFDVVTCAIMHQRMEGEEFQAHNGQNQHDS